MPDFTLQVCSDFIRLYSIFEILKVNSKTFLQILEEIKGNPQLKRKVEKRSKNASLQSQRLIMSNNFSAEQRDHNSFTFQTDCCIVGISRI